MDWQEARALRSVAAISRTLASPSTPPFHLLRSFAALAGAVVLDFCLPDGTGLEFIRALRAQDSQCPILLITGQGSIELGVELMKAGADDLMTKPVSLAELRDRLQRRRGAAAPPHHRRDGGGQGAGGARLPRPEPCAQSGHQP